MQSQAGGFAIVERANTGLQATLLRLRSALRLNPTVGRLVLLGGTFGQPEAVVQAVNSLLVRSCR